MHLFSRAMLRIGLHWVFVIVVGSGCQGAHVGDSATKPDAESVTHDATALPDAALPDAALATDVSFPDAPFFDASTSDAATFNEADAAPIDTNPPFDSGGCPTGMARIPGTSAPIAAFNGVQ